MLGSICEDEWAKSGAYTLKKFLSMGTLQRKSPLWYTPTQVSRYLLDERVEWGTWTSHEGGSEDSGLKMTYLPLL